MEFKPGFSQASYELKSQKMSIPQNIITDITQLRHVGKFCLDQFFHSTA